MSLVIERVLDQHTRSFESADLERVNCAMAGLNKKRQSLLGVEALHKDEIERHLATLARDAKRITFWQETGLKMIDEQVLRWRIPAPKRSWRSQWLVPRPRLTLTSLQAPETTFSVGGHWMSQTWYPDKEEMLPLVPAFVNRLYRDVHKGMAELSKLKKGKVIMSTTYQGIIPDKAKEEIANSPFLTEEMYLLREVKRDDWSVKVKEVPRPPRPALWDPLVVGIRDATMWLVTSYDPTPLEQYIEDEFAMIGSSGLLALESGK